MSDERRVVTVLFADVTGSTALGETLDPEDLRALLSRYYAIAKDVVGTHGGTVEKFIGDAVMAVFGLRQAFGDDAARALSAALELRDRVRSDAKLGERLPIRLGVNTGDVVASRDERSGDFLVTGDAVNVAARLQQGAAPWVVIAGERTVRAARGAFRFNAAQTVDAKGKTQGLVAREVVGHARAAVSRTPLFGRDADLAQLELVARRAFTEQRPYLVSLIAPPGTGKSRLLEEFLDRLPGVAPDARVAVAQCLPYGQQLTYWPLRAVLFRLVGLDEDAGADEVRRAVLDWLRESGVEEADEIGALLASTVGAGDAEATDRNALFAAWRTVVEVAARSAPLVICVEDLHWSSDSLLDLVEYMLQPRGDTRALLIALARPELLDRRAAWGGGRRNSVTIALEPLDDGAVADLVRNLAEGTPKGFVNAVVERAEGNPFFATEIVNSLMEQVRGFDDPAEVGAALERLPDTVQATVLARLDVLPEQERQVIRVGSVFGRSFRPAGVTALLAEDRGASVEEACEQLVERDMIRPSGADGYVFRHILIREVAYGTLPRAARATLHGAAGRWLEERATGREEAFAELVAYHYREAATLAAALDLEGVAELREKARGWLVRATEVARVAAATVEARAHARAALEFATPDNLPEMTEFVGDTEIGGGTIIDAYQSALSLARAAGRGPEMILRLIARILAVEMRSQGAVANRPSAEEIDAMRAEGRALLDQVNEKEARARFLVADAFYPFWTFGSGVDRTPAVIAAADASARAGLDLARELDDANLQSAALDALGSVAQIRTEWGRSLEFARERMAMGSRLAMFERIDAHSVAAWAAVITGQLAVADDVSAAGLAIVQPRQAPDWTLHLVAWRLLVLLLVGKWDEAEKMAERAYSLWHESGRPAAGYALRGFTAAMVVGHARRDSALIAKAAQTSIEIGDQFPRRRAAVRTVAAWNMKDLAAALEGVQQPNSESVALLLSILTDAGQQLSDAQLVEMANAAEANNSDILRAAVLRANGLHKKDAALLISARERYEQMGALPYAARTRCEAAILTKDEAEFEAGLAYLESLRDELQVERYLRTFHGGRPETRTEHHT